MLMTMPDRGSVATFLAANASASTEGAEPYSAAQAALWAMERKNGIKNPAAYTAVANASIAALKARKALPPGGILHLNAKKSAKKYYSREESRGIMDPDAVHVDNVLDINARKSAAALRKVRETKATHSSEHHVTWSDTDDYDYHGGSISNMLQKAAGAIKGAVKTTVCSRVRVQ